MNRLFSSIVALLFAAFTLIIQPSAHADTFGTSGNEFTIDFVNIGDTSNAPDTTGYGAVPYEYRVGTYEITEDAITKATASGMANVGAGAWAGNEPAGGYGWYEAAAFVNFLNTSSGKTAAYNLTYTDHPQQPWDIHYQPTGTWNMTLWSSEHAWTAGGENLYRHKDAFYFLPSENEWYKAAYYNPAGSDYFLYPTASNDVPAAVASGTDAGTAVYNDIARFGPGVAPTLVESAGGLSPYGTMGQGGNVWEWTENEALRGGSYQDDETLLHSSARLGHSAGGGTGIAYGFRVASVPVAIIPEPSTYALLLMTGAGALWWARRRR